MASGRKGLSICETPAPLRARTIEPIFSGDDDDFESRMCQHSFGSPSPPPKSDNNNNNNNKNCSTKRHGNSKRNDKLCSPNDKLYKLHRRKRSQSMDASQVDEQATKILQTLALQHDSNSNSSKNNRGRNRKTNRNDGNSIDKSDIDLQSTWNKSKRAGKDQSTCKNKSKSKSVNKRAKTHKNTNSLSCMTKRNSNLLAQLNRMNDCDEDEDGEYENTVVGQHGSPLTRPVSVTVSPASVSFNASYNYHHNYNKHPRERQRPGTARSRSSNRNGNRSRHRGCDYNCSSINMKKYGGNVNPRRSMHSIQLELRKNIRKIKELEKSLAGAQLRIKSLRNDKKKLTKEIGDLCGIQAKIDAKMTRKSIEYHKMEQELRLKNRSKLYQINRRMTMLQHEKDSLRKESLPSLKQIDKDKKKDNNNKKTRKCNRHSHSKTISGMEDNYNMKEESESTRNSNNNCSVARERRSGGHKRGYKESGSVDIGRLREDREHSCAASINTNVNWKHCAASSFISNTSTASHVSNVSGSIVSKLEEYDSSSQSSVGDGFVDDVDDDDTMSAISTLSLPGHVVYSGEYGLKEEEESNDDICGGVNVNNNNNNQDRNTSSSDEFGNLILNMNSETKDEIFQKMMALVAENNRQRATIEQLKSMTNNGIEPATNSKEKWTAKQESQQNQQQTRGIEKYSDCGAPVVVPRISILQGQLLKTESLLANLEKRNLELKNKIALKDKEISMLKEKRKVEEQEKDKEKDKEKYQQQNQEQEVEEIKALKESNNGENGEVYINMKMNINKNDILGNDRNKEDKKNELIVDTALKMLIMSDDQHESEQTDVSSTTNMKTNNGNDDDEPGKAGGDTPWETISLQSDIEQTATLTKNDTTNAINMKQNMFTVSNTTDNGGDVSNGSKNDRWHLEQNNKNKNKIRYKNKGKDKDKDTGGGIKKETKMKQREGSCDHRKRTHSLVNRIQNTYSGVPFGGGCLSFCDSSMCYVYNCQDDDISDDENLETDTDIAGSSSSSCSSVENYQGYDSYED